MIKCQRHHLEQRAAERGYSWESVVACIAATHEDGSIEVNEAHPAYPRAAANTGSKTMPPAQPGPGTELAILLKRFGIHAKEKGCGCRSMQRKMDAWGPENCRKNIETILQHLSQEARKRGLPFVRFAAKRLVIAAISKAEKKT